MKGLRLDHISYATTQLDLLYEVQRIGSLIDSSFIDGGVHPRFGTRNFILPLQKKQYIEIVCPLEHPAAENSYFGKMVTKRAREGGGWMTWVVSVGDISYIETKLGRQSIEGIRRYPNGKEIRWKQIGVRDTMSDYQIPFFIEWLTTDHPSFSARTNCYISKIEFVGNVSKLPSWLDLETNDIFEDIQVTYSKPSEIEGDLGITSVTIMTPKGEVVLS